MTEKGQIVDESATKRQPVKEKKNTFLLSHRDTAVGTKKHTNTETKRQTDKQTHTEHE